MDLTLEAEQQLLVESARSYLARACPASHVRAMEADPRGFDPKQWQELASLGWLGTALPEDCGGSGRGLFELALLLEEMGRVLLPAPFLETAVVAAPLLEALGDAAQRARWLPAIAAGECVATLALVEPGARDEWQPVALEARPADGALRLSGCKRFVPWAASADLLLVAVRFDGAPALLAVEGGLAGVAFDRHAALGSDPLYEVRFEDARVPREALLGAPGAVRPALERALQRAAVGSLAFAVGAAERALELSLEHARTREQFGRPIGSFQAVAHRCVDMRSDIDALRYLVYRAAWSLEAGGAAELEVAAAKAYGNEALGRVARHAHQVHGAIGFSTECDLQLFTRCAKAAELRFGSTRDHQERVARAMGL